VDIAEECGKTLAGALKIRREDPDVDLLWRILMPHEQEAYRRAAVRVVERYLELVASPPTG